MSKLLSKSGLVPEELKWEMCLRAMARRAATLLFFVLDALFVNGAYLGALILRFDAAVPAEYMAAYFTLAPAATILTIAAFYFSGLYQKMWRYAGVREIYAILQAVTIASLLVVAVAYILVYPSGAASPLPRSIYPLAWLLNMAFVSASRLSSRSLREVELNGSLALLPDNGWGKQLKRFFRLYPGGSFQENDRPGNPGPRRQRVLIAGAGDAGAMVVRELRNHPALGYEPVGFVDDDPRKKGLYLLDVPILGDRYDIPRLVEELQVDEIIIAMPSVPGRVVRELVEIGKTTRARLKTVPGIYELINGRVSVSQIREVQVEDLLGREPVKLDLEEIASYLAGQVVLVTGAGGSIGSELCRQIARFRPASLVLLDCSENNLFEIEQELRERHPGHICAELADVRDGARVEQIFERYRPQVVFHAAAYKHVPMMERCPEQAVSNNILGTYIVAAAALRFQSKIFILVSTDKAVRPLSVMGATKRAAEMLIQYLNEKGRKENLPTRFAAVRFGNVLGSRGSVIPIFKRQIARGGPVTVTHPEMVRYFMTIPEAVQLIIQAGALAEGGEIFVLDMGEPVKIVDLARDLIRLSGLVPGRDIEIRFTGIRPGEKLKEELFTPQEERTATRNSRIFIARQCGFDPGVAAALIDHLRLGFGLKSPEEALALLDWLFPAWRRAPEDAAPEHVVS